MTRILQIMLLLITVNQSVLANNQEESLIKANVYFNKGEYQLALKQAQSILENADTAQQILANALIGNILLAMNKYEQAEKPLLDAYNATTIQQDKASYANSLAVLYQELGNTEKQQQYFQLAKQYVGDNKLLALKIQLNQLRNQSAEHKLQETERLLNDILAIDTPNEQIALLINLAETAKSSGKQGEVIAKNILETAQTNSSKINDKHLLMELLDSLADSYEQQGNYNQALVLTEKASTMADVIDLEPLLINIEWRKARLYQRQQRDDEALTAFGKAVDNIQAVRMDIPVEYHDGKSSFRETLEPVYLGYAYQLLKKARYQDGNTKQQTLLLARKTVEQIKQTEMEDFLGGRCLVEGLKRNELEAIDESAAILYPIILPDRLEILLSIGQQVHQYSSPISKDSINDEAIALAEALRNGSNYRKSAQNLYQWIIAPIEKQLSSANIKTLVIVPDGVLRLIPFSALFDGEHFLLEKYAVSISPGMSLMSDSENIKSRSFNSLLLGLSTPGSVVEKLPEPAISGILDPSFDTKENTENSSPDITLKIKSRYLSSTKKRDVNIDIQKMLNQPGAIEKLKKALSLPGVEKELSNIKPILKNNTLLNENFTIENFQQHIINEPYEIVHIASHGIFSSDTDNNFLMAYDNIIKLETLETLLQQNKAKKNNIELLTFSACETAEGDDRAPMGFAGAALRAKAKSALGSLWSISDEATSQLMTSFYRNLTQGQGKAEALRQAQLELLHSKNNRHPYFWSPFILVGNWL